MTEIPAGVPRRRREFLIVTAICAAAVALRFAAAWFRGRYLGWDEVMYLVMGRNLLTGHGYQMNGPPSITFPPLPGIIGAAVWMLTGSTRWAFSGPTAVLGGLAAAAIYLAGRRMFSRNAGLAAAVIYAGLRPLLLMSPFTPYKLRFYSGSEDVHIFFVAWGIYFFWRALQERSILSAALAGLSLGVGFEVRQEALVLWGALAAWLAVAALVEEKKATWNLIARLAASAALFAAAAAPWFAYTYEVTGQVRLGPHLSHNMALRNAFWSVYNDNDWRPFFEIHHGLNEDATEFESPYYGVTPWHKEHYYSDGAGSTLASLVKGLSPGNLRWWARDLLVTLMPWYFTVLAAIGLAARRGREAAVRLVFFAASMVPAALIASTLLVLPRYNIYAMAPLSIFAGAGAAIIGGWIFRRRAAAASAAALAIATAAAAAGAIHALYVDASSRADRSGYDRHVETIAPMAARELRALAPKGTRVLSHGPQPVFLAGDTWVPLPTESFERIVHFAKSQDAPLILLSNNDQYLRPFEFDEVLKRSDLVSVAYLGKLDGERVAILRVTGTPGAEEPSG